MTNPPLPAWPGPGSYPLPLATWGFGILVGVLVLLVVMYLALRLLHPAGRRWVQGYLDAAGVTLGFLLVAVVLVAAVYLGDPQGNRSSLAIYETVLQGYWLALAVPIVTVGSSVHSRTRGGVPWRIPSVVAAVVIFFVFFAYYYYYGIPGP
jgi:hypothetical protein